MRENNMDDAAAARACMQLHDRHTLIEEGVCAQVQEEASRRRDALAAQTETGNEQRQGEGVFVRGGGYLWIDARSPLSTFPANLWRRRDGHMSIGVGAPAAVPRRPVENSPTKSPHHFLPSAPRDVSSDVGERERERETEEMSLLRSKFWSGSKGRRGRGNFFLHSGEREGGSGKTSGRHRAGGHNKWVARSLSLSTWINSESR